MIVQVPKIIFPESIQMGTCYSGASHVYVPIPKAGSSYSKKLFRNILEWPQRNFLNNLHTPEFTNKKFIVMIRDPLERWLSGMAEYFDIMKDNSGIKLEDKDTKLIEVMMEQMLVDDHTIPQYNFLEGLNTDNCVFFNIDKENFQQNFDKWVETNLGVNRAPVPNDVNRYSTKENTYKHIVRNIFKSHIMDNTRFKNRFNMIYKNDYTLLNIESEQRNI